MASAQDKFFTNGGYEMVLSAKADRPSNKFRHSAFTRDSYLSANQNQISEGAPIVKDDPQDDVSIISKFNSRQREAELLQASLEPELEEQRATYSDHSSVEEDSSSSSDTN